MGEYADDIVRRFESGKLGGRLPPERTYPTTKRELIAGKRFKVVVVLGGKHGPCAVRTNRIPDTQLVVCDNEGGAGDTYWVWTSAGITGIHKGSCKVLHDDLALNDALKMTGRKLYAGPVAEAIAGPVVAPGVEMTTEPAPPHSKEKPLRPIVRIPGRRLRP